MAGLVIVGGGLAGAKTAQAFRSAGGVGPVTILAGEGAPPLNRPPLSKAYLRGGMEAEATYVEPLPSYVEQDVDLRLGARVDRLDLATRRVTLADGESLAFDRLVLATGTQPRRLPVPGADLPGIHVFRTLEDATRVREEAVAGSRAVVVGGSFIGMEVAASLTLLGMDVTVVELGEAVMPALAAPELSTALAGMYRERGVTTLLGESVSAFTGDDRVRGVELASGAQLPADLVVMGVGVAPLTGLAEAAGIRVDDGIVVDERFESSARGVFAAGDVARFPDLVAGRMRRIEHWTNANGHGLALGRILAGDDGRYDDLATFFTMLFDVKLQVLGDLEGGVDQHAIRGDVTAGSVLVLYARDGVVTGATLSGQDEEVAAEAARLVRERAPAGDLERLAAELSGGA